MARKFTPVGYMLKAATAAVVAFWVSTPEAVQFLLMFMALDFATGLLAGFIEGKLDSKVSYRGLAKKSLVLIMVTAAHLCTKALHVDFDLGSAVAIAYTISELISITENCHRAGVPVPQVMLNALARVKKVADDAGNGLQ